MLQNLPWSAAASFGTDYHSTSHLNDLQCSAMTYYLECFKFLISAKFRLYVCYSHNILTWLMIFFASTWYFYPGNSLTSKFIFPQQKLHLQFIVWSAMEPKSTNLSTLIRWIASHWRVRFPGPPELTMKYVPVFCVCVCETIIAWQLMSLCLHPYNLAGW